MADETDNKATVVVPSSRFGDMTVPANSMIEFPNGLIGFPKAIRFVMVDHKAPFSWLHSADDPNLAFVVVDGFEFGASYDVKPPLGDKECDFKDSDEYAILVIVTVRPDPRMTTANLKAPLFVNLKNRKGVQVIFDSPRFSTRYPLWAEEGEGEGEGQAEESAEKSDKPEKK